MKKKIVLLLTLLALSVTLLLSVSGCGIFGDKIDGNDLRGEWEMVNVTTPDGKTFSNTDSSSGEDIPYCLVEIIYNEKDIYDPASDKMVDLCMLTITFDIDVRCRAMGTWQTKGNEILFTPKMIEEGFDKSSLEIKKDNDNLIVNYKNYVFTLTRTSDSLA